MPLVKNRRCEFIRTVGGIGSNEFDPTVRHEQLNLTALIKLGGLGFLKLCGGKIYTLRYRLLVLRNISY
jgi:hypothetical protein